MQRIWSRGESDSDKAGAVGASLALHGLLILLLTSSTTFNLLLGHDHPFELYWFAPAAPSLRGERGAPSPATIAAAAIGGQEDQSEEGESGEEETILPPPAPETATAPPLSPPVPLPAAAAARPPAPPVPVPGPLAAAYPGAGPARTALDGGMDAAGLGGGMESRRGTGEILPQPLAAATAAAGSSKGAFPAAAPAASHPAVGVVPGSAAAVAPRPSAAAVPRPATVAPASQRAAAEPSRPASAPVLRIASPPVAAAGRKPAAPLPKGAGAQPKTAPPAKSAPRHASVSREPSGRPVREAPAGRREEGSSRSVREDPALPAAEAPPRLPGTTRPPGMAPTPLRGDLKLVVRGGAGLKVTVAFREYSLSRRTRPPGKAESRRLQKVAVVEAVTGEETREVVVEKSGEGIYLFTAEPSGYLEEGGNFTVRIYQRENGTRVVQLGSRRVKGKTVLVRVLMPEGILWEDDAAFTGTLEDADSVTKFNARTGLYWKEYND
ncbi:hypothetical protein [Geomonas sp. Red32]|uniref:hypothetical protein n=1 Tax=Geomonas sp. Red32 TaxID=2912856 RepID=UPI00254627D9|nr:hypothetical protein [Geomonas sp. Red32]